MAAKGDDRFTSATYFVALTDFAEPGELSVFIDEDQLHALEERMRAQGFLDGSDMATTFNMLRANDLIWSFVVNNYLLGKEPFPFDLLYWNSDSTRMPAAMHSFYLRNMYQENKLVTPGGITLCDVPIDLGRVAVPSFLLSTHEDHIAPWRSTYAATQIYKGPVKFVLAASGHIAGVVNPPGQGKYGHWQGTKLPKSPDDWLKGAKYHEDSWWPTWEKWISKYAGGEVPARQPGDCKLSHHRGRSRQLCAGEGELNRATGARIGRRLVAGRRRAQAARAALLEAARLQLARRLEHGIGRPSRCANGCASGRAARRDAASWSRCSPAVPSRSRARWLSAAARSASRIGTFSRDELARDRDVARHEDAEGELQIVQHALVQRPQLGRAFGRRTSACA